ncbi:MAG: geranylgeranyl pyrophosphate synthetase [Ramalina farinacea]|uniref:Geranylgeranyl pyrophosphate synthetase n=1 Tax=Ramalina farinacea TaxID=258253 RepID=A0AA43QLB9_9LECA|nr:geranylgeranyl pyrophosphate synthetase [Ramalina farinacea]
MTTPSTHQSPNAIPPRRSSTGYSLSQSSSHPLYQTSENPSKPVLKPVPESSWMASPASHTSLRPSVPSLSGTTANGAPDPSLEKPHRSSPHHHHKRGASSSGGGGNADKTTSISSFSRAAHTAIHEPHSTWSPQKEQILLGPYDYMVNHPGKDIRKQLISAFNAWLRVPEASLKIITKVVGMLHTASLLVDDVEDFSQLRRGVPVANRIFGEAQTINSANYVYFAALRELTKLEGAEMGRAIRIYTDELCNLHRGQGMDLFWRDTLICPSEQDYLEMVGNKTGGLFRLAVLLMQAESRSEKNYIPLVNTIGLLFQIRDDYMNLSSPSYTETKGVCEDLTEGKFSFPIIHSIRSDPSNLQLMNILKQKTTDMEVKKYAVRYMEKTGSFEYCRMVLGELHAQAIRMCEELDPERGRGMLA